MSFLRRLSTPLYQNTGSTARDHLASERTYLSWLRTGLGFIALGIAIQRFNQLDLIGLLSPPISRSHSTTSSPDTSSSGKDPAAGETQQGSGNDHVLVGALLGTGGGSIVYGTARYFSSMRMLERGMFKPAYFGAMWLSVSVAGLAGGVYVNALRGWRRER
ncbi:hypothetical protein CC78DRAFT_534742 [Lojkania enalia]|uniref:DUF202 domain-containing protein n=1 Tax=Lojkania enalia TaxID=147567 RepID=A0A9P4KAN1_9PLEO|nr:hypothetical protein CC78DRAFT_534742 [Didymosphaeria enalia]